MNQPSTKEQIQTAAKEIEEVAERNGVKVIANIFDKSVEANKPTGTAVEGLVLNLFALGATTDKEKEATAFMGITGWIQTLILWGDSSAREAARLMWNALATSGYKLGVHAEIKEELEEEVRALRESKDGGN